MAIKKIIKILTKKSLCSRVWLCIIHLIEIRIKMKRKNIKKLRKGRNIMKSLLMKRMAISSKKEIILMISGRPKKRLMLVIYLEGLKVLFLKVRKKNKMRNLKISVIMLQMNLLMIKPI